MIKYLQIKGYTNVLHKGHYQNENGEYVGDEYTTDKGILFFNWDSGYLFDDEGSVVEN